MAETPFVTLVLPAYNEVGRIGGTIGEAAAYFEQRGYPFEIIVCADGDDGTRELVARMARDDPRLQVIGSAERRGKGHAVRSGVALARGDVVGFADADNKTPIEEFDKFVPWLRAGHEVVIGSRALRNSRIERPQPLYRRLGARGFALLMHAVVGLRDIADTQCGFKFFLRHAALDLFRRQRIDGYMLDVEVLRLARQSGYRIVQVPVRWRDDGDSRLALVGGNVRNVVDLLRIRFASGR
ncbi:MAG: glycosyltransferase family 2 protein [Candidatus Rokubacteria bacterium]|nr:glycosyltransferase family 2 protein [Candidatus Rokubacteria bacterium]